MFGGIARRCLREIAAMTASSTRDQANSTARGHARRRIRALNTCKVSPPIPRVLRDLRHNLRKTAVILATNIWKPTCRARKYMCMILHVRETQFFKLFLECAPKKPILQCSHADVTWDVQHTEPAHVQSVFCVQEQTDKAFLFFTLERSFAGITSLSPGVFANFRTEYM